MKTKGDYCAELLQVCIKDIGLTPTLVTQLEDIIQEQFAEGISREVSGAAYYKNGLELEKIHSPEIKPVEEALQNFLKGDYNGLLVLSQFAERATKFHLKHHGKDPLFSAINIAFRTAYDKATEKPEDFQLPEEVRREWAENYKLFLKHYTVTPFQELKAQPGFLGCFHVHRDGTKPSPGDIAESLKTGYPELVISSISSYHETGLKLYLVHSGAFELLYDGPLLPKREK